MRARRSRCCTSLTCAARHATSWCSASMPWTSSVPRSFLCSSFTAAPHACSGCVLAVVVVDIQVKSPSVRGPRRTYRNARVLVVEDNPAYQRVITLQLESLGVAAELAENGAEALEALTVRPYPLVLMDCQMPVMD